jgi:membrane-associated phospholipid phosphatase
VNIQHHYSIIPGNLFKFSVIISISCFCIILPSFPVCAESVMSPPEAQFVAPTENTADQEPETTGPAVPVDKISLGYVKGIFTDTGKIVASPLHWDSFDWMKAGIVFGATGGLYLLDGSIRNFAQSHQNSVVDKFAFAGNGLGNPLISLPSIGAFYLYGSMADNKKARETSLLAIESLAISELFTGTIKVLAQRDRPNTGASPSTWNGPHLNLNNLSFCSGHTTSSFSIATVIAEEYKETWYVPPIAYSLAALTGLSRVYGSYHWSSDVFFGAAVGYFVGQTIVKYHMVDTPGKFTLIPMVDGNYKGLALTYKF